MQSLMLLNSADLEKAQGIKNKVLNGNDNTQEKKRHFIFSRKANTVSKKHTKIYCLQKWKNIVKNLPRFNAHNTPD